MSFESTAITVEYGQDWNTTLNLTGAYKCQYQSCGHVISVFEQGSPTTLTPSALPVYSADRIDFSNYNLPSPLPVGKHVLTAQFKRFQLTGHTSTPLTVTVTPTSLQSAVRMVADPSNTSNAVISATLSGKFVNFITQQREGYSFPAGTWQVDVKDAASKSVFTKSVTQPVKGDPYLSVYWANEPPGGGTYTATASFTPDAAGASNFMISSAQASTLTVAAPPPTATPEPTATPVASGSTVATGPSVPAWVLVVAGLLGLILVLTLMLLSISLNRSVTRRASPPADSGSLNRESGSLNREEESN